MKISHWKTFLLPVHVQTSSIMLLKCRIRYTNESIAFPKVTDIPQLATVKTAEDKVADSHSPSTNTDHQTAEFVEHISPFRNGS
jgi:hypothetical protein